MPHVLEPATSGRAKCRGCGEAIANGALRFGERMPNPFGDGEATLWFHPMCAAYKRPEPLLEALNAAPPASVPDHEALHRSATATLAHRRLPRIDGAERARSGQAKCRLCKQPIARDGWRIRLVFFEDGRFSPGGTLHLECRLAYFETPDLRERVLHFSPKLTAEERADLARVLDAPCAPPAPPAG